MTISGLMRVGLVCLALPTVCVAQAPPRDGKKYSLPVTDVKKGVQFGISVQTYYGTVEKIDGAVVTLCGTTGLEAKPTVRTFEAIDALAEGGLQKWASGCNTYLWSDLRTGDVVRLGIVLDEVEQKRYCVEVCINRRPGGKLPASQSPEEDGRYKQALLLNDIDNGEDVSDEDIAVAFPRKVHSGTQEVIRQGGLDKEYQAKLDAIRAKKKEQALKAQPPEKKEK
jgi:hypothetical protein